MTTLSTIVDAAVDTYNPTGKIGPNWTLIPPSAYTQSLQNAMSAQGFYGEAWYNSQTGEVIIAGRGTWSPGLAENLQSDGELTVGAANFAQSTANDFAEQSAVYASHALDSGVSLSTIYTTGHSLAGSESQGEAVALTGCGKTRRQTAGAST